MKEIKCSSCGEMLTFLKEASLQIGKYEGIFGSLTGQGKEELEMEVYVCPACSKIEMYAKKAALESLKEKEEKAKKDGFSSHFGKFEY